MDPRIREYPRYRSGKMIHCRPFLQARCPLLLNKIQYRTYRAGITTWSILSIYSDQPCSTYRPRSTVLYTRQTAEIYRAIAVCTVRRPKNRPAGDDGDKLASVRLKATREFDNMVK